MSRLVGHEGTHNSVRNSPSVAQPIVQEGYCDVPAHGLLSPVDAVDFMFCPVTWTNSNYFAMETL